MVAEPKIEYRSESMAMPQKTLPPLTFAPRSVRSDPDRPITFATVESHPNGNPVGDRINGQALTATAGAGSSDPAAPSPSQSRVDSPAAQNPFIDDSVRRARRRWIMLSSALAVGIFVIVGLILMR